MISKLLYKLLLVYLIVVTPDLFGQTISKLDPAVQAKIDSTYEKLIEKHKVVGTSIAIVDQGELVYATGYGFQDKEKEVKASANSVYRIGSCTKSFTALSLMQLQEAGKIDIKEPIQTYLPAIKIQSRFNDPNPIAIRNILSHSSGLPSDMLNGFFCDNPPSMDWVIQELNKMTMSAPAGYQHAYSNIGYGLLGKLISEASGLSYAEYLEKEIFQPLGMKDSWVEFEPNRDALYARAYFDGELVKEPMIRDQAAGLIHSSVVDMGEYLKMLLGDGQLGSNRIASSASIAEMEADALTDLTLKTSDQWGYGLISKEINIVTDEDSITSEVIGHGGDTWCYHADFQYIPDLGIGAVILTNTDKGVRVRSASRLLKLYMKEAYGKQLKVATPKEVKTETAETLPTPAEIIGRYSIGGENMEVTNTKKIKIKPGGNKIILKPVNDSLRYAAKAKLFGFIPFKVKHQQFRFVNKDGKTFFKVIHMETGKEDFAGVKEEIKDISPAWKERLGKYAQVDQGFACTDCPIMNFTSMELELKEEGGVLKMGMEGKSKDTKMDFILQEVNEGLAVTAGIGRNTGETIQILDNGNLYYSGFEFTKSVD